MTSDDQARADATAEEQTVDDPLDTSNVPDPGATELAEYNAYVDSLEEGEDEQSPDSDSDEAPEERADDEESPGEEEDDESESHGEEPAEEDESDDADAETEEDEDEAASGEEDEEPTSRSERYRIRAKDEVEAEALSLRKRHPDWSLEQCLTKAKAILGVEEAAESETSEGDQTSMRTLDDVTREIEELRDKHEEATENLEFKEASAIFRQMEKLRDEREELRIADREKKSQQEQEQYQSMERQFRESEKKAVTYYPETTDPDSAITKRIIELDQQMRDLNDPLYSSPDKPFILAKQAAKELGIPMSNPKAAKPKKKTAAPSRPVNPASGNARTNPKAAPSKVDDVLAGVDTVEAYEDLVASL
jgi:hypothetical protein